MASDTSRLRILHVTPYAPAAWAYGGIPRLVGTLTRGLASRGHAVTVCTTDACDAQHRLVEPDAEPGPAAPPDWQVFPNVSNRLAYHRQCFLPRGLGAWLRVHAREFDIGHLHACRNVPGVLAAHHLRQAGVPYVVAPNGTAPRLERAFVAKAIFDGLAGTRILQQAAGVLAVSAAEVGQLAALRVRPRVTCIPNPIDVREFDRPTRPGVFRRRHGLGDAPVVMFLGKLTPRKRVDVLVNAFARCGDASARLVIAGNDMGVRRSLDAQVARLGLVERTTFTGLLTGADRIDALGDATVVVYPSESEIFGLVALEAVLAGTPIIVADDCGCGEIIREIDGGAVVPVADVQALAAAIADVLRAPAPARARTHLAAVQVRRRYSGEAVVDRMEQWYRSIVDGRPTLAERDA